MNILDMTMVIYLSLLSRERVRESAGRRGMHVVRHRRPDPPLVRKWLESAHISIDFIYYLITNSVYGGRTGHCGRVAKAIDC